MFEIELKVLTTVDGHALLTEVQSVARPGPSDLDRWRKSHSPEWVSAALRIAEGRRKGATKFTRADRMWFDPVGVEQATAEAVARHKARRFADAGKWVVDLCSGIGGDALALGDRCQVMAVDVDVGMTLRTAWNAGVYEVDIPVQSMTGRAEDFEIPYGALVHIDPDRRAGGRPRAKGLADYAPGLDFLRHLASSSRGGAFKLGPSSDFEAHFDRPEFEIEVVSLGGECKEATVWCGDLATPGMRRRATCLPSGATWTDQDGPSGEIRTTGPLQAWAFDPDPALVRSGLLDGFAIRHGLRRIAAGVDLLTGPSLVVTPFLTAFHVVEAFPLDLRVLRREVAMRGLGPLEIKTRGTATTPEAYRAKLRPQGPNPATLLLISGHPGPSRAILARRV
jgi:hypothetical protein